MALFSKKNKDKIPRKSWQRKDSKLYPKTSEKSKARKKGSLSRFIFWVLLFSFLVICTFLLFFSTFLDIDKLSIEGNQDISSQDIAKSVEKSFDGRQWLFFPRKNFFLVNKSNIEAVVKNSFNRLDIISVEKKFPNTLFLKVAERKAELVWCSAGVCYFVDKNGLAYGGSSETEEELRAGNFLVVVDDSARPIEIGKTKINPDYIEYIEAVSLMIQEDLGIGSSEKYHTPGIASQEISIITGEGWTLKISREYSVEEAKKIIQTFFEKDLNEEKRRKLEYLDMRIKNKVYYKIKPEEEEVKKRDEGDEKKP